MVTGATGLLGSHLLCHLARCGETIIALKRYKSHVEETMALFSCYFDSPGDAISRVTWVVGDVLDGESVAPFVEKVDTVYHCAAMVSFNGSDRNTLLETNIKGTESICKICLERGVRLCFVSSIAALGDAPNESVVIDENTPEISASVHSLYSGSKGESEKIVWEYVRQGLDVVIVNPAIILGAGLRGRSSVKLFEQASKGMPFYHGRREWIRGCAGCLRVDDSFSKRSCRSGRAFRVMRGKLFLSGVVYRDSPCRGETSALYPDDPVDDGFGLAFTGFRDSVHGKETGFHEGNSSFVST